MALQCGALAAALGMGHPDLLAFIRACTPARWTLVYRMLAELADRGVLYGLDLWLVSRAL